MKVNKKGLAIVLISVLLACSLTGCKEKEVETEVTEEKKIQIGMCFDTFVIERWERDRDVFVSTANELGAEVDVQNPNGNVEEQISAIEYFIEKNVDVIVVVPIDCAAITEVINRARSNGIKVIAYDRLVTGVDLDLYISFDNEAVGSLMASSVSEKLIPGDRIVMLCGPETDNNVEQVKDGFIESAKSYGFEIEDCVNLDEWKSELAYQYVSENIDMIKNDVKAILCGNDNLASQVIYALSENRLAGKIVVTGQDADLDACQRIAEGTQYSTVYKPVNLLASQAAHSAVDLALGKGLVYDGKINNGWADIPYIRLEPTLVTAENMDETVIKDGFHQADEIYINIR